MTTPPVLSQACGDQTANRDIRSDDGPAAVWPVVGTPCIPLLCPGM